AAAPGHGTVVHHGALFAGHSFSDQSGEGGSLLTIEVSLEAMTHGFVQKHAGPTGTEHHFHFAGRSLASVELQNRLARSFFGEILRSLFAEEEVKRDASPAAGTATRGIAVGLSDA